jgi:hypothetical protein
MQRKILSVFNVVLKSAAARRATLMAGAAAALVAGAAISQIGPFGAPAGAAAPPSLSGNYAFILTSICQIGVFDSFSTAGLSGNPGGGYVNSFGVKNSGDLTQNVGVANFNSSTHKMTFTGAKLHGPQVLLNVNGFSLTDAPETLPAISYSNTATTLTLDTNLPYNVTYASITGGIAHYFVFAGTDNANSGCAHSGHAMRQ